MIKKYWVTFVDDNEDDRFFLTRILQRHPLLKLAASLNDGTEAIAYLSGSGIYQDRKKFPVADLLLLDLKMPDKTGWDVLHWLQAHPMPRLRVVVLSDAASPEDRSDALQLGCHAYHVKPLNPRAYEDLLNLLYDDLQLQESWGVPHLRPKDHRARA